MAKTTELELAIKIAGKVDPSLQAAISQAQKQVSTLSATLGTVGRVGLAAMGVAAVVAVKGIADCTKEAEKFESQMAPVTRYVDGLADSLGNVSDEAATNGKTFKENYGAMADYIQDLSTQIPRTTEQIATMSAALGQSGMDVDVQLNTSILKDTATAATAMDLDDDTAGQYMAKWEKAFNFDHDQVMQLMDQINYLGANNATTAAEIAESVNKAASMGQIAGLDPAATAALATAMQATGVATDRVGTSITRMYTNLSKGESATKAQKEMFEELGLSAEGVAKSMQSDGVGTMLQVFDAIKQMPSERKVAALSTLFGQWAIEGGAKVVNNMDVYEQALKDVQDPEKYTGSMQREFIIQASTTESLDMMMGNAKTALMQDIGEQFLPVKKQFATLAIDMMNGLRQNMPQLTQLASTLADIATKGVTALGDALQSAMPYIQQGLDYLNQNGEKVAKILAGMAGAFAAMSIAPQAEIAAKGVGSVVKGGAGMFSTAVSTVSKAGGTAVKTGGNLLGGLGTLRDIVGAANQDAAMNGSSTTGVLARLALGSAKETKAGKAAVSVGNWAGNLFGNAKDFALSQWDLSKGMADGAIAGANGVKSFINNIISPAEPATTTALVAAAPTALTTPGTAMTAAQAPLSDMGLLGAVMSRLRGGATAAQQVAGNPLKDAGMQILQGAGGMASSAVGGVKTLATGAMPFVSAFGGIASAALPVVAVIGSIVAAVSLLGEHLDDIRSIINNVFGEQGVAVFDGFLNTITGIKDKIVGVFSPENLASVRTAIVGMFGENAGTGFDNIVSIGQSVIGVFQQIVNFGTQTVKPMFEQVFGWVSTTLLPGLLNAFNAIAPQIGPIITNIGTAVMNVANMIGNAIQAVLPVIESIIMVILSVVSTVGPPILAAIAQIAQNIGNVITSIQGVFEGLIQFITGVFTGNWSSAWEGVKSIFSNAFSALVELCKIPINAVIGVINGAINGINSILGSVTTIPEWVPVVGGKGFSMQLPTIPMLAKGGFTDGVSIAGEAGTEAVISFDPSVRSANIANWQKAGQMLGVDPVQAASVAGAGSLTTDRVEVADIGGGSPAPGGTTTVGGGSFTFSPKITIQGNADYNVMMNAMTDAKDQFEQWFNEMMRKQQRTAYAR
ncbi:phage tail tape measure protein [Gemmiger sp.]|uniref:phage tail tape measure protein n=1 Tax=Gemmiger sp. TaxID=2049027 RepID=UPI003AB11AEB